ncbi:MAG: hypothetical protein ACJAXX_000091 [Roseivirga sp.]|jgi:hypothetical protein
MIKTFTQNDLIRYVYQETLEEENIEIDTAAIFDEALADELHALKRTMSALDAVERIPSFKSIDKILSYSKSYDLHSPK